MPRRIDMRGRQRSVYPIGSGSLCTMRPIWNFRAASGCRWPLWTRNSRAQQAPRRFRCVVGHRAGSSSRLAGRVVAEADQQFAEIPTLQEPDKGLGGAVEALGDVLAVFELAAF